MERKLRKYQNMLVISGLGVIIFGAWNILKIFIFWASLEDERYLSLVAREDIGTGIKDLKAMTMVLLIIISAVIMYFHLKVGRNAIREGMGLTYKKYRFFVLFLLVTACLDTVTTFYSVAEKTRLVLNGEDVSDYSDVTFASFLVSVTLFYVMCQLSFSLIRTRSLKKKLAAVQEVA